MKMSRYDPTEITLSRESSGYRRYVHIKVYFELSDATRLESRAEHGKHLRQEWAEYKSGGQGTGRLGNQMLSSWQAIEARARNVALAQLSEVAYQIVATREEVDTFVERPWPESVSVIV